MVSWPELSQPIRQRQRSNIEGFPSAYCADPEGAGALRLWHFVRHEI